MQDPQERVAALEAKVAALDARMTTMEEQIALATSIGAGGKTAAQGSAARALPHRDEGTQPTETLQGMFSVAASVQVGEQHFKVRVQEQMQPFFEADAEHLAHVVAALGSPHRITIVRALCTGPRTALQLQEELGMGSVGQLYHHLKELLATGLVTQDRRSVYTIPPTKRMWIYLILMAGFHLMPPTQGDISSAPPSEQGGEAGSNA